MTVAEFDYFLLFEKLMFVARALNRGDFSENLYGRSRNIKSVPTTA